MRTILVLLAASCSLCAERLTLRVTADTTVTFAEKLSMQDSPRGLERELVLQGRASFALLQFDTSPLKGLTTTRATLRVHAEPSPVPLHTVGVSTVSGNTLWKEAEATFYRPSSSGWWAWHRSDLVDVTFSQGGSLYAYPRARIAGDGWFEIDVPATVVTALATGDQFGIMLTDEKGQTQTRHVLSSREGAYAPVLIVEAEKRSDSRMRPLRARRAGDYLVVEGARARLDVRYAQAPVRNFESSARYPRWLIDPLAPKPHPLATSNSLSGTARISLKDLPPGTYHFAARSLDDGGTADRPIYLPPVRIAAPRRKQLPPAPQVAGTRGQRLRVWAAPDTVKINPVTGALLEKDVIWPGVVRLTAARNEFVAFQLAVEGPQQDVSVEVSKPLFTASKLPAVLQAGGSMQLYRQWFVPDDKDPTIFHPDPLIPLTKPFDIPSKDNPVPKQTVQPVFVDIYVAHDAKPGLHTGELRVRSAGRLDQRLEIEVTVLPLSLPDKVSFVVDLNCYSGVEGPKRGTQEYRAVESMRSTGWRICIVRTSMSSATRRTNHVTGPCTNADRPRLADARFRLARLGCALWSSVSGELFKDMPRAGVPVEAMYLPFFEHWPGDLHKHYKSDYPAVAKTPGEYRDLVVKHALTAPPRRRRVQ